MSEELKQWKLAHQRLLDEMTSVVEERDTLRKKLEIAVKALTRIGDDFDGLKPGDIANQALMDMSLVEIERIGNKS